MEAFTILHDAEEEAMLTTLITARHSATTHVTAELVKQIAQVKGFDSGQIVHINATPDAQDPHHPPFLEQGQLTQLRIITTEREDRMIEIVNCLRDHSQALDIVIVEEALPYFGGDDLIDIAQGLFHGSITPILLTNVHLTVEGLPDLSGTRHLEHDIDRALHHALTGETYTPFAVRHT